MIAWRPVCPSRHGWRLFGVVSAALENARPDDVDALRGPLDLDYGLKPIHGALQHLALGERPRDHVGVEAMADLGLPRLRGNEPLLRRAEPSPPSVAIDGRA